MEPERGDARRIRSHRDLKVWQKAMWVAERCCRASWTFPPRAYALAAHLQKTAIAIPSNIAEGHELHTASFAQHVSIALGSIAELDTQLELACRLDLVTSPTRGAVRHAR